MPSARRAPAGHGVAARRCIGALLPALLTGSGAGRGVAEHYGGAFDVAAFSNTTYEALRPLLLEGRPFVVLDGARELPMASWNCDFVRKTFPGSRIRHEGGSASTNGVPMSSDWTAREVPFPDSARFPPGAPRNRPFYWDIAKAHEDEPERKWGQKPREVVRKIVKSSAVPYWLPQQGAEQMGQSSEMWFHPRGAGAPAHMDPHCATTVSFCFSGRRKWRMMVPPEEPHTAGYFDGHVYGMEDPKRKGEWQPTFEFEAPAGSAVVVYPGMVHETLSVSEECSSSISQTFQTPIAAAYYRAFWPRFALLREDTVDCAPIVEDMVTLGSGARVRGRAAGAGFAARVDADGDGTVSPSEILAARRSTGYGMSLEELVAFHDTDRNGVVTAKEVEESWVMFATAAERARSRGPSNEL